MLTTTLKALRENCACIGGYNSVVRAIQGKLFTDEDRERETYIRFAYKDRVPLSLILENNGLDDALWALRAAEQTPEVIRAERLFAVWCARQVQHLMTDQRSLDALDVAERYASGHATGEELAAAWDAARAAGAAWVAGDAARAAAWAAGAAWAAWVAARAAAWVAGAAGDAGDAWAAARAAQKQKFIEVFCCNDAPNIEALAKK